jgi:hypothetical protein
VVELPGEAVHDVGRRLVLDANIRALAKSDLGPKPMVSRHSFLTPNNQTPYVFSLMNTKGGLMVLEPCHIWT